MRVFLTGAVFLFASSAFGQSPLYWALANNDALEVWNLAPDSPQVLDENGLSAPAWAVERGNAEAIEALMWRGVKLDEVDPQGRNLLFGAAALGRLDLFDTIVAGQPWAASTCLTPLLRRGRTSTKSTRWGGPSSTRQRRHPTPKC